MIKYAAIAIVVYTAIASALFGAYSGPAAAWSCAAGGGLMLLNLLGFYFLWTMVFKNKSVAVTSLILVGKYAALGLILWGFTQFPGIHAVALIVGLSSLVIAIVSMTAIKSFVRKNT